MDFVACLYLTIVSVAVVLFGIYLMAFLKRRQIIISYPVPGPEPSTWNIFWPFGNEIVAIKEQLTKGANPGKVLLDKLAVYSRQYGEPGLYRAWLLFKPAIVLTRPDTAEVVLKSIEHTHKADEMVFLESFLGEGLITSNGAKWSHRRKMLSPVFHLNLLDDFLSAMNEQAALLTNILLRKTGESVEIFDYISKCALSIICETAMGISIDAQSEHSKEGEYINGISQVTQCFIDRIFKPWLWPEFVYWLTPSGRRCSHHLKVVHGFTRKVIAARMKEMQEQPSLIKANEVNSSGLRKKQPFLDTLLIKHLQDNDLTIEDVREEVDTFMLAGHDALAIDLMWTVYLLGHYPEIQAKVHDELDRVFGDDRTRPVTSEDLNELRYLECVMKESSRLYPPAPLLARKIVKGCNIGKYHVTAGTTACIDIVRIHRDPGTYKDPDRFDPDRFLPEKAAKLSPYAFLPFSAGPRSCVGQKFATREKKVILSTMLRRLQVKSLVPREEMGIMHAVVSRPTIPLLIEVTERPTSSK